MSDRTLRIAARAAMTIDGAVDLPAAGWFAYDERKPFQLEDSSIELRRWPARRSRRTAAVRVQVRWHLHGRR